MAHDRTQYELKRAFPNDRLGNAALASSLTFMHQCRAVGFVTTGLGALSFVGLCVVSIFVPILPLIIALACAAGFFLSSGLYLSVMDKKNIAQLEQLQNVRKVEAKYRNEQNRPLLQLKPQPARTASKQQPPLLIPIDVTSRQHTPGWQRTVDKMDQVVTGKKNPQLDQDVLAVQKTSLLSQVLRTVTPLQIDTIPADTTHIRPGLMGPRTSQD